jgi:hypothetical protein
MTRLMMTALALPFAVIPAAPMMAGNVSGRPAKAGSHAEPSGITRHLSVGEQPRSRPIRE